MSVSNLLEILGLDILEANLGVLILSQLLFGALIWSHDSRVIFLSSLCVVSAFWMLKGGYMCWGRGEDRFY